MEIDGYAIHPRNSREIKLYRFAIERSSGELSKAGEAQNQQNTMENNENQQKETKRNEKKHGRNHCSRSNYYIVSGSLDMDKEESGEKNSTGNKVTKEQVKYIRIRVIT